MTSDKASITAGGLVRFKIYDLLATARTHSRVEYCVLGDLREKLLPAQVRQNCVLPTNPNAFSLDALNALAVSAIEVTGAEVAIMARGMSGYMAAPGVPHLDGEWFYPILELLESSTKEKP